MDAEMEEMMRMMLMMMRRVASFRTVIKDIRCLRWTPRWRR